jgi:glycosyltransferase involved in cell wall biosynthesis
MKILYLSCHIVLEYDELRILNQLGYDVTAIGGYIDPKNPHVDTRPPLNIDSNKDRENKIHKLFNDNRNRGIDIQNCSNTLTKEVVDDYDVIMIMHRMDWVEKNWDVIKNKIVILRTIGQNLENNEILIKKYIRMGLKILRYSPKERELNNYAGEHGLIRFLKYKSDFKDRNVKKNYTITFTQNLNDRKNWCGLNIIEYVSNKVPFKLFGPGNEKFEFNGGRLSYDQQLEEYASNSCYLYTGTFPAQYTLNFVEALIAGIPIVSIGKNLSQQMVSQYPFEVPYILDEVVGYSYDDIDKIVDTLNQLIMDKKLNNEVSRKQTELGVRLFSVEKNIHQWKDFLNNV